MPRSRHRGLVDLHEFGAAAESIDNLPQSVFIHTCCFRGSAESATPIRSSDQPDGRWGAQFRDAPFRLIPVGRPSGRTEGVPRRLLLESWHCPAPWVDTVCVTDRAGVQAAV